MVDHEEKEAGDAGLVFAAHNVHHPRCGRPPRLRNTADRGLYYGYFENRHREQFVFALDRATGAGTISGGDLGWDNPKPFTLELLEEALRQTQRLAAQITEPGLLEASGIPVIDAALALGRLTGLTAKEEVTWLRACLAACTPIAGPPAGRGGD
jgi:hypothetical protein